MESARRTDTSIPEDLILKLHAHAALELTIRGFSLLTDPWLNGPAFMGAWTQYPPAEAVSLEYRPDAIWISHEHSDHFHEPTLDLYDRATPIFVPAFPNERLENRCRRLGFVNVRSLRFGEPCRIAPRVEVTCFEPGSLWNDASALIEVDGFRILNINDAGLNRRLRPEIGAVDVLCSAFGVGASGYPLTWGHLDEPQKHDIIEAGRLGMFEMLKEATAMYEPTFLIPFAGHFALWHPDHAGFVRALEPTQLGDVAQALENEPVEVIELLPGDSFRPASARVVAGTWTRTHGPKKQRVAQWCQENFDQAAFLRSHPADAEVPRDGLERYLLSLNSVREIAFCEDMSISITLTDPQHKVSRQVIAAEICNGRLALLDRIPDRVDVEIAVPSGVMRRLIDDDESWDEAHIGYWCRFNRSPDVYHANFWRLLQAPRFGVIGTDQPEFEGIGRGTPIAEVLERFGDDADRVLRRRGMYCVGCHRSPSETLAQGARNHGLTDRALGNLLTELNLLQPF